MAKAKRDMRKGLGVPLELMGPDTLHGGVSRKNRPHGGGNTTRKGTKKR